MVEQKSIIFPSRSTQCFKNCSEVYCRKYSSGTKQLLSLEMSLSDLCYYIIPHLSLCYKKRHLVPSLSSLSRYLWPVENSKSPGLGLCPRDRAQVGCLLLAMAIVFSLHWWLQKYLHSRNVLMFGLSDSCPVAWPHWEVSGSTVFALSDQMFMHTDRFLCEERAPHFREKLLWGPVHRVGDGGRADVKTACDKGTQIEGIDLNGLSANIYIVISYTLFGAQPPHHLCLYCWIWVTSDSR